MPCRELEELGERIRNEKTKTNREEVWEYPKQGRKRSLSRARQGANLNAPTWGWPQPRPNAGVLCPRSFRPPRHQHPTVLNTWPANAGHTPKTCARQDSVQKTGNPFSTPKGTRAGESPQEKGTPRGRGKVPPFSNYCAVKAGDARQGNPTLLHINCLVSRCV